MERPKDELKWSEETLIYVDYLEFEINRLKEFDKIDFTYWLYEEITMKKPPSELVQSLIDEYLSQNKQ